MTEIQKIPIFAGPIELAKRSPEVREMIMSTRIRPSRLRAVPVLLWLLLVACDEIEAPVAPEGASLAPGAPTDPAPWAPGLFLGNLTFSACTTPTQVSDDLDYDAVRDDCENALAAAFAPLLFVSPDCTWDDAAQGPGGSGPVQARLGGDYGYAAQRFGNRIRLAYLPAYYWDCGIGLGNTVIPDGMHNGDSELILIDVHYDQPTQHWVTDSVFLSAHCGTSFGDPISWIPGSGYCRWFSRTAFEYDPFVNKAWGAPIVWVAVRKHANYVSEDACDRAYRAIFAGAVDECDFGGYYRFPIQYVQQNIGSGDYPLPWRGGSGIGCATPFFQSQRLLQLNPQAYSYTECWWKRNGRFYGWLPPDNTWPLPAEQSGGGVEYGDHLAQYAGMTTGQTVILSPPVSGLSVQLEGSTQAPSNFECSWVAVAGGGQPPYSYEWRVDGFTVASGGWHVLTYLTGTGTYNFLLSVQVTDALGSQVTTQGPIAVSPAGQCLS